MKMKQPSILRLLRSSKDNGFDCRSVENGEYLFDQKTGTIKRMPMSARTATKVASDLFDKRQILRKQPTKIVENHNIADRINQLASEFAKFSAAKTIEGTVIQQEKEDALGKFVTTKMNTRSIILLLSRKRIRLNENSARASMVAAGKASKGDGKDVDHEAPV